MKTRVNTLNKDKRTDAISKLGHTSNMMAFKKEKWILLIDYNWHEWKYYI